jgi:hypothetical protein
MFFNQKTVVSTYVSYFGPGPETTPPLMPRAVPLPPRSPVTTATLPWAEMRDTTARARMRVLVARWLLVVAVYEKI